MSAALQTLEVVDESAVEAIVEGRFTDAGRAIGAANPATLEVAVGRCAQARSEMRVGSRRFRHFSDLEIICRARIRRIAEKRGERF